MFCVYVLYIWYMLRDSCSYIRYVTTYPRSCGDEKAVWFDSNLAGHQNPGGTFVLWPCCLFGEFLWCTVRPCWEHLCVCAHSPAVSHGCAGSGLWHWVCQHVPCQCASICVLLTTETAVHLYRHNVCGDYLYRHNVLYVEMCPCARLVECTCVVSVDDHESQIIKIPLFFLTFPALFQILHECHPKQCWSCRTVREETNICILSVYVCVCLNKVYWGWGSTRGTCNTIPCNSSLALHRWKEGRGNHHEPSGGLGTKVVQGRTHGWRFTQHFPFSSPPEGGFTVMSHHIRPNFGCRVRQQEARPTEWCVLMALVKSMVTLGRGLRPASFSLTLHLPLSSFLYHMPFPVPSQIKIKPAFLLQLRRLGGFVLP